MCVKSKPNSPSPMIDPELARETSDFRSPKYWPSIRNCRINPHRVRHSLTYNMPAFQGGASDGKSGDKAEYRILIFRQWYSR